MSLEVKNSPLGGRGLFASRPFKRMEYIIEYYGKRITNAEAEKSKSRYLFMLNRQYLIDGSSRHNLARYINHSCKPNAKVMGRNRLWVHAIRNIKAGDEIVIDYGEEYVKEFLKPCRCPNHKS